MSINARVQKLDRRIQRTQRALTDALIALAHEKGYDAVTIRDITEHANVAYSTFFRHYTSKDDLLASEIQSIIDELQLLIQQAQSNSREAEGILIFQHIAAHPAFFRTVLSSQGTSRVLNNVQQNIVAYLVETSLIPADDLVPAEIAANHFVVSVLGLIRWWLDHDMPYSIEQMAAIYSRIMRNPAP